MTKRSAPPRRTALECLESQDPCLGAVFCSYTFDPIFFESHVLRTILKLQSDPDEQLPDFLSEGLKALQGIPVACFVDVDARTPGQRLPYDLRLISGRVFHPKLALLVHQDHATLLLGSGNLTRGGYGDNTELWFPRKLRYGDANDVAALRELLGFLDGVEALASAPSPQLALVRATLTPRLSTAPAQADARAFHVLHSLQAPLLPTLLELIPRDAEILQLGMLAPFFERDDQQAADLEQVQSLVTYILSSRKSHKAELDLGFGWQGGPLGPPTAVPALEQGLGQLWVHRVPGDPPTIEYFIPLKCTAKTVRYLDHRLKERSWPREDADEAHAARQLYPAAPPIANGPARIVEALANQRDLRTWLLPTLRFDDDRPVRRPLHAKLLTLTTERRGTITTYILVGSPNASGRALLHPPPHGNVELAVVFTAEGTWQLPDLAPELIACPRDQLQLADPVFPASGVDLGRWIDDATYDPRTRELRVLWADGIADPPAPWRLHYVERQLAHGDTPPSGELLVGDFDLLTTSCELTLEIAGVCYSVPIRVTDIGALPVDPVEAQYGLAELIALLSRRIGRERLRHVATQTGRQGTRTVLETIFGEGFTPTDIFRTWKHLAHDLVEENITLAAFRHILAGPIGVRAVWQRMREAIGDVFTREVVWFYGAELLKTFTELELPADPDQPSKRADLAHFLNDLRADLAALAPDIQGRPWIDPILRFYQPLTAPSERHDPA